jgi:hypothetical protein
MVLLAKYSSYFVTSGHTPTERQPFNGYWGQSSVGPFSGDGIGPRHSSAIRFGFFLSLFLSFCLDAIDNSVLRNLRCLLVVALSFMDYHTTKALISSFVASRVLILRYQYIPGSQ